MKKRQKQARKPLGKKRILTIAVVAAAVVLLFAALFAYFDGVAKIKRIYYGYKVRAALDAENQKLKEPLKLLGFTNIEGGDSTCEYAEKYGYPGLPLDCRADLRSYMVFNDEAQKERTISAAEELSKLLEANGWKRGSSDYEISKWFKDVTSGTDWNADAYHYKYFDNTYCVLDFFVAYSNPKPPAVNAVFLCNTPELHPFIPDIPE